MNCLLFHSFTQLPLPMAHTGGALSVLINLEQRRKIWRGLCTSFTASKC